MFTSGVTLIPTLSCQDKESAVYTTENHDNGIATLTEARCLGNYLKTQSVFNTSGKL